MIIDTPGIDDTRTGMNTVDIVIEVANRLADMCVSAKLAGIL